MLGPELGSQQPQAALKVGDRMVGKGSSRKGPEGADQQPAEHVCPGDHKVSATLDCIKNNMVSRTRAVIFPLYSAQVTLAPHFKKGIEVLR